MTVLLSFDPGESTGWSGWYYDATTPLRHIEHGTIAGGLHGFMRWWNSKDRRNWDEVVAEDFILDGRTRTPNTTPLEILGALEALWPGFVRQKNTYKVHAPDKLLKARDLWWKGKGHDRDSARHAIAYMKVRKHAPTLEWLYGKE